jgi:membrane-bound metal-dependent hydrolase YbcI (DUF457 family)
VATPLGHYLVGLSVAVFVARSPEARRRAPWWAVVACAPDLDVLPGLAVGNLSRFHHGASHSLTAAVAVALVVTAVVVLRRGRATLAVPVLAFVLFASHIALDSVTVDSGAPIGVPLFWPFSQETYQAPWALLPNVQHTRAPVVSVHNALLMVREVVVFAPLVGLALAVRTSVAPWRRAATWVCGALFVTAAGLSIASLS